MKEVETKGTIEVQDGQITDTKVVNGYLKDNGKILSINIDNTQTQDKTRFVWVDKLVIDAKANKFIPARIHEEFVDFVDVVKDIEVTLSDAQIIEETSTDTLGTIDISIEFFTYEANITTDYGTKRLSVPYNMTIDSGLLYNALSQSSDGWYQIGVIDVPTWEENVYFEENDIVYKEGVLYIAIRDTEASNPTEEGGELNWRTVEQSDLYDYLTFITRTSAQDATLRVLADTIITRRVKYTILYDILRATDFEGFDNVYAMHLATRVSALRDLILLYLHNYEPTKAIQIFNQIEVLYSEFLDTSTNTTTMDSYKPEGLYPNNYTL